MGRLQGKVAFVTGAARGQGRSHAVRLAEEGADIIAVDICRSIDSVPYELSSTDDLLQTVKEVEAVGRTILASVADVRSSTALQVAVDEGVKQLGRLDIVCANAGVLGFGRVHELSDNEWQDMLDVNLTGVWRTCKVAIPHMIAGGRGGSIILTSSAAALKGKPGIGHYSAAKTGLVGLMRTMANELGSDMIRVNTVHPTAVETSMVLNPPTFRRFRPDLEDPAKKDVVDAYAELNILNLPWIEAVDVSNAIVFLASDEARYITGVTLPVDAGAAAK